VGQKIVTEPKSTRTWWSCVAQWALGLVEEPVVEVEAADGWCLQLHYLAN